jgi:hypothetical protein
MKQPVAEGRRCLMEGEAGESPALKPCVVVLPLYGSEHD